jgi:hypothetical protein
MYFKFFVGAIVPHLEEKGYAVLLCSSLKDVTGSLEGSS